MARNMVEGIGAAPARHRAALLRQLSPGVERAWHDQRQKTLIVLDDAHLLEWRTLGIPEDSPGWPLLETLSREGTLGREYLTPDLVDLGPGVTDGHCDHWIDFLIRMGCIDEVDDQLTIEPVVSRVL